MSQRIEYATQGRTQTGMTLPAGEMPSRINASEKRAAAGQPVYTGRVYCDRKCYGQWLGRNHGIQTRPQGQYNRREHITGT